MSQATAGYSNRLALIFDFDKTLAPDTFPLLLAHLGIDAERFDKEKVQPLVADGWHDKLAQFHCLIEKARNEPEFRITRADFTAVGQSLRLYAGVPTLFERLRACAREVDPEVDVRFYLLTAGMVEIP